MIYCAEGIDNTLNRADIVKKIQVATDASINVVDKTVSETAVKALEINAVVNKNGTDYPVTLTAIPYYVRAYRDTTTMRVYFSEHTHSYSASYDQDGHFDGCICGDKINLAAHVYGEWQTVTEATDTADGEEERFCECGYRETRVIPATGSGSSDPSGTTPGSSGTTPENPDASGPSSGTSSGSSGASSGTPSGSVDSGDSDNVGLIVGLSVGGTLVASAAVAAAIVAVKKRKIKMK